MLRRQEVHRRAGFAISADEERLRCGLERIWAELTSTAGGGLRVRFQEAVASFQAAGKENRVASGGDSSQPQQPLCVLAPAGGAPLNWTLDDDTCAELKEVGGRFAVCIASTEGRLFNGAGTEW